MGMANLKSIYPAATQLNQTDWPEIAFSQKKQRENCKKVDPDLRIRGQALGGASRSGCGDPFLHF